MDLHNKKTEVRFFGKRAHSGHTLAEMLAATAILGAIFVLVTSLYVSGLKFFNREVASPDLSALIAFETITRNVALANQAIVDAGGMQLKLRIDRNALGTPDSSDDTWVCYGFLAGPSRVQFGPLGNPSLSGQLRFHEYGPPGAVPADVTHADEEVIAGLKILKDAGQSCFVLENPTGQGGPTIVNVQLVVSEGDNVLPRTLATGVALRRSK